MTLKLRSATLRSVAATAILAGAAGLGGCGMSSLTSGIGGGVFSPSSTKTETASVNEQALLTAARADGVANMGGDVAGGCPRFQVWSGDRHITIYETGRVGDGLAVMHRGEITQTSRECQLVGGRLVVKYGFGGKVLLGPRGKTGVVSLSLTVFVTDSKRAKITNEKVRVDVNVALENPVGYFSFVREVAIPVPEGSRPGEFEVFVAFDRTAPGAG